MAKKSKILDYNTDNDGRQGRVTENGIKAN